MKDKRVFDNNIFIQSLRVEAVIGVYDEERAKPQTILVDCEVSTANSFNADALELTICYDQLQRDIRQIAASEPFHLLEYLGQKIMCHIKDTHQPAYIRLKLSKPETLLAQLSDPIPAAAVGVEMIHRTDSDVV